MSSDHPLATTACFRCVGVLYSAASVVAARSLSRDRISLNEKGIRRNGTVVATRACGAGNVGRQRQVLTGSGAPGRRPLVCRRSRPARTVVRVRRDLGPDRLHRAGRHGGFHRAADQADRPPLGFHRGLRQRVPRHPAVVLRSRPAAGDRRAGRGERQFHRLQRSDATELRLRAAPRGARARHARAAGSRPRRRGAGWSPDTPGRGGSAQDLNGQAPRASGGIPAAARPSSLCAARGLSPALRATRPGKAPADLPHGGPWRSSHFRPGPRDATVTRPAVAA